LHIQSFGHVLADQHLLLAGVLQVVRFDDPFDALEMRRKALAGPGHPLLR
jgi:hypothetical protein